jgi:hypothetical protein
MNFNIDQEYYKMAQKHPLNELGDAVQFQGYKEDINPNWVNIINKPMETLDSSPESIIESAQASNWLTFLLKVGRWGHMIPGPLGMPHRMIYGSKYNERPNVNRLNLIEERLESTYNKLLNKSQLEEIWDELFDIGWSKVIISKCLHFQARAADMHGHIPVAIDKAMAVDWLWPKFRNKVLLSGNTRPRPAGIQQNQFSNYRRYLSSILGWADKESISSEQLEIRLFNQFRISKEKDLF